MAQFTSVDGEGAVAIDEAIQECLPAGTLIIHAVTLRSSAWAQNVKLTARLPDSSQKEYFLESATERGRTMIQGEFQSISAINSIMPGFTPKPWGWGKLKSSDTYFFLMDFLHLNSALPSPMQICPMIAPLHRDSISPTGKFGFHVPTCHGKNIQPNYWESSWAICFAILIRAFFKEDVRVNGSWPEYDTAFEKMKTQVIPRLLGALQDQGRVLKPCLVHGDLWDENTGVDAKTGKPVVFDASCLYAHNEYELGMWRRDIIRFNQPYIQEYLLHYLASDLIDEFDARNRLYSIKFNLGHSISFLGSSSLREQIYNDMTFLNRKYGFSTNVSDREVQQNKQAFARQAEEQSWMFVSGLPQAECVDTCLGRRAIERPIQLRLAETIRHCL